MTHLENENPTNSRVCSICGWEHATPEEARACESQGEPTHELEIGDRLAWPLSGGVVFEVINLLAAHGDHEPGVELKVIQGDVNMLYIGGPAPDSHMWDEATAKKYLIPKKPPTQS